jgi:hypothetical protein
LSYGDVVLSNGSAGIYTLAEIGQFHGGTNLRLGAALHDEANTGSEVR